VVIGGSGVDGGDYFVETDMSLQ